MASFGECDGFSLGGEGQRLKLFEVSREVDRDGHKKEVK